MKTKNIILYEVSATSKTGSEIKIGEDVKKGEDIKRSIKLIYLVAMLVSNTSGNSWLFCCIVS